MRTPEICTDELGEVFRLNEKPWIDPDGATIKAIIAVVESARQVR